MVRAKPTISVVIPTKNRPQDLITCLKSIITQTVLPDEVVIVDASDEQALKSHLNQFSEMNTKYIPTARSGTTIQRNIGIRASFGDIVVFSDDDMIWDEDFLKQILSVFKSYPPDRIGGVTARIVFGTKAREDGNLIKAGLSAIKRFLVTAFFLTREGDGKFQLSGMPTIVNNANQVTGCEFLYGGCMAFRRQVIEEFMFDENLVGYGLGEDDDIAYRVSRKYQNYYTPHAQAIHSDASTSTSGNSYEHMTAMIQNRYYLFRKNLPQTLKHKLAFYWAVVGLFVVETLDGTRAQDYSGLKGLVRGLKHLRRS